MIEKMHFVNIAGPIRQFDAFVIQNVLPHEVQLINAYNVLDAVKGLRRFSEDNPYEKIIKKLELLANVSETPFAYDENEVFSIVPIETIEPEIDGYERQIETIRHIRDSLKATLDHLVQLRMQIIPIRNLEIEVDKLFKFEYMKFRFGRMPKDAFNKLQSYIENLDVIAYKVYEQGDEVYLVYFTPAAHQENIDSLFASIFFKRIRLSDDIKGYPHQALETIDEEIEDLTKRIKELEDEQKAYIERNHKRIQELFNFVIRLNSVFGTRRFALRSDEAFYLTGWIPHSRVEEFMLAVRACQGVSVILEDDGDVKRASPPTKLYNNRFFKPFEMLVNMYGTPSYDEMDPTIFVGITYLLLFGMMFGDVGQGMVIALLGFMFYLKSKSDFGRILTYLGFSSSFFGLFYGSFFGNETFLREHLSFIPMIHPMEEKMTILGIAVVFGIILIMIAMVLNMINSANNKNIGRFFFDRNGIAGLVFYLALLYIVISIFMSRSVSGWVVLLLIIAPLIVIFLAHPLEHWFTHKKIFVPKDKVGYFVETFFELIETVLAILSNTISFMRVGAFALNHVGFFMAFKMLSELVGGSGKPVVMIFGNILIIALEGLIVGIQGLRLEYYELFSRFFKGEGEVFKPFVVSNEKQR